jgi:hypothetical protein
MLLTRNLLPTLLLVSGVGVLAAPPAHAGLIPNKVTLTPESGMTRWTYNVVVTSDLYVANGDYFTIYDFAGAVDGQTMMPDLWTVRAEKKTTIPPRYGAISALDDPDIDNYTFTYVGKKPIFGSAGLGNFSLLTPYSAQTDSVFTSVNHRQDSGTNEPDPQEFTLTPTVVPVAAAGAETPEPGTLIIAAAGLPLAGLWRLRRRR